MPWPALSWALSCCRSAPLPQEELGTPALAFVCAVCEALGLDAALEDEVLALRANLLRLTHTREFAPEAQFRVRLPSPEQATAHLLDVPAGRAGLSTWPSFRCVSPRLNRQLPLAHCSCCMRDSAPEAQSPARCLLPEEHAACTRSRRDDAAPPKPSRHACLL